VVAWVGVGGWLGYTWLANTTELRALEPHLEQARAEHKRFKAFLDQKHKQEQIRDSLLSQITTIQSVDGDRYVWPHVLDEVTRALPAYTWLVDMSPVAAPPPPPPAGTGEGRQEEAGGRYHGSAGAPVPGQRAHGRYPGLHPLPPESRGLALDQRSDAGLGDDHSGA
jgi:hypothetical protein